MNGTSISISSAGSRQSRFMTPPSATSMSGSPAGRLDRDVGVVEQHDRLELRPRRAQEREPNLLDLGLRPLVRKHLALGVRGRLDRPDDPGALPHRAVDVEELLLEPPERRLVLAHHAALAPAGERLRGLLGRSRQGQVDDVVVVRQPERLALVVVHHVVRRRDEVGQRPGDALVVPERAKRRDRSHVLRLPNTPLREATWPFLGLDAGEYGFSRMHLHARCPSIRLIPKRQRAHEFVR